MKFTLKSLAYPFEALEPYFDAKTMEIHHDRHHQAYVDNLNKALEQFADAQELSLEEILQQVSKFSPAVRNNAGGHYNHQLFWDLLSASGKKEPEGDFLEAIQQSFGSLAEFKGQLKNKALGQFGSGWAWLIVKADGTLAVSSTANQDNPLMDLPTVEQGFPVLGLDVWEHAYYLNYQNKRADYVDAFWEVLNWESVEAHYKKGLAQLQKAL